MQKSTTGVLVIAILIIALGGFLVFIQSGTKPPVGDTVAVGDLLSGEHFSQGIAQAPISIVEFADFQCPACAALYPILKKVVVEYPTQVYFVFRNFPLAQHAHARSAAAAAEAAGLQGKFWEMHDWLFENQNKLNDGAIQNAAQAIGLDTTRFEQDWKSAAIASRINQDISDGARFQVSATPTTFINGKRFVGGLSEFQLKGEIEKLLQPQSR